MHTTMQKVDKIIYILRLQTTSSNPNDSLGKKRPAIFQSLMLGTSHKHDILPGT